MISGNKVIEGILEKRKYTNKADNYVLPIDLIYTDQTDPRIKVPYNIKYNTKWSLTIDKDLKTINSVLNRLNMSNLNVLKKELSGISTEKLIDQIIKKLENNSQFITVYYELCWSMSIEDLVIEKCISDIRNTDVLKFIFCSEDLFNGHRDTILNEIMKKIDADNNNLELFLLFHEKSDSRNQIESLSKMIDKESLNDRLKFMYEDLLKTV
jgi:hypothetical protein